MKRRQSFHLRSYRRIPVQCELYFSNNEVYGTGTVWNLSPRGWRVDSSARVEHGTTLTLFLLLPDTKQAVLVDRAEVCWSRGHEFGLKVLSITPEDDARLAQFVSSLIGPPLLTYRQRGLLNSRILGYTSGWPSPRRTCAPSL